MSSSQVNFDNLVRDILSKPTGTKSRFHVPTLVGATDKECASFAREIVARLDSGYVACVIDIERGIAEVITPKRK